MSNTGFQLTEEQSRAFREAFPHLFRPRLAVVCDHEWEVLSVTPSEYEPSLCHRWMQCRKCRAEQSATAQREGYGRVVAFQRGEQ